MLKDLMSKRAVIIEEQAKINIEKQNIEDEIRDECINNFPDALSINWAMLNRAFHVEPDRMIKRRVL